MICLGKHYMLQLIMVMFLIRSSKKCYVSLVLNNQMIAVTFTAQTVYIVLWSHHTIKSACRNL